MPAGWQAQRARASGDSTIAAAQPHQSTMQLALQCCIHLLHTPSSYARGHKDGAFSKVPRWHHKHWLLKRAALGFLCGLSQTVALCVLSFTLLRVSMDHMLWVCSCPFGLFWGAFA